MRPTLRDRSVVEKVPAAIRTRSRIRIPGLACYQCTMTTTTLAADLDRAFERHRGELKGYCHRILGSASDAEDAVQDTLVRGWRHIDRFEGRASLRSWLYRIATNVCTDMLRGRQRQALPMDFADDEVVADKDDPAEITVERDAVRRAFVAALAALPPRQRAAVILPRRAALGSNRSRRPPRHHSHCGEQHAPTCARHLGENDVDATSRAPARRSRPRARRALCRRLRALRRHRTRRTASRGGVASAPSPWHVTAGGR